MRVALLRGINVGGHKRVPMTELRAACTAAGLTDVRTHATSGNLVFADGPPDEAACATRLGEVIAATFGFDVPVVVRDAAELREALAAHPFDPPDGGEKMLHIVFCDRAPDPAAAAALDPEHSPNDRWTVIGREIHVRYGKGSGTSKLTLDWFERRLHRRATGRNVLTVRTLVELSA